MAARNKKPAALPAGAVLTDAPAGSATAPTAGSAGAAPAATRPAEIETKLEIDPTAKLPSLAKRRRLAAVGIAGAQEPKSYQLDATYYDTAGLDLLQSKMTLRRRTGGPDAGWHSAIASVVEWATGRAV